MPEFKWKGWRETMEQEFLDRAERHAARAHEHEEAGRPDFAEGSYRKACRALDRLKEFKDRWRNAGLR